MTLAGRLHKATGAPVLLAFAERLPQGRGYRLHLEEATNPGAGEPFEWAMNRGIEGLIRQCPTQYLWGYDRYKVPKGSAPMPGDAG
jgi:KDO2-lipid IV(A) lauroyltransferase